MSVICKSTDDAVTFYLYNTGSNHLFILGLFIVHNQ